jgi:hypothetical protein
MDGLDLLSVVVITAALLLGLYWLSLLLRSEWFWDWFFGSDRSWWGDGSYESRPYEPYPPKTYEAPYEPQPWPKSLPKLLPLAATPPKPREQKDFGSHNNPLALEGPSTCDGLFERMDPRTWQCLKCHLLNFVELEQGEPKS